MKYINLNPKLTSGVLESAGFTFDGYYRVHRSAPVKLLPGEEEGEYEVYLDGIPTPADRRLKVIDYHSLIALLQSVAQFHFNAKVQEEMQRNPNGNPIEVFSRLLSEYWSFDENLVFAIHIGHGGAIAVSPNNEYTLSLMSGNIRTFRITTSGAEVLLEVAPEAMSLDYAESAAKDILGIEQVTITKVEVEVESTDNASVFIPFFGAGMRKVTAAESC